MEKGKDYELVYGNNTSYAAGAKNTVTVKGIGGYVASEKTESWTVEPKGLNSEDITVIFDKKAYKPGEAPTVTVLDGKTVVDPSEYTVAYDTEEGIATITSTGKNYSGAREDKYDVTARGDLANAIITVEDVKETGVQVTPAVTVQYGNIILEEGKDYTVSYGENIEVGIGTVTITAVEGNADYKGSQTVEFNIVEKAPEVGQAMIADVEMIYNRAHVTLSGDVDGAEGYDYVIATENDYVTGRVAINKNHVATSTDFLHVQKGVYYAYCHAWKRVDGKKIFGDWSNAFRFEVSTITPDQPVITSVTRNGSDVTVTFTNTENAIGYDVVFGTKIGNVYGEKRPVEDGELVKKGIKNGRTSVTFKNVPAGTYYAGLHAFNRSAADNKKVFSPWSNSVRVIVK